jgi:phosphatidate cytidylyltransferase
MKRVATAVVLIPLVIIILLKAPYVVFVSVVFIVAMLAAREYLQLSVAANLSPLIPASFVLLILYIISRASAGVTLSWGPWRHTSTWASTVSSLAPLVLLIVAMFSRELPRVVASAGSSFLVIPYIGMTLSDLFFIRRQNGGALLIFFFFLIIWIGDASAYYVGRSFGSHKFAPTISPNKSWEGSAASFIGSVVTGLLLFHFVEPISNAMVWLHLIGSQTVLSVDSGFHTPPSWTNTLAFAAATNVAAQLGDLLESAIKRGAAVKDSGALLPGHGGILDRIDALLLALPVLWYYAIFLLNNHLWFLP